MRPTQRPAAGAPPQLAPPPPSAPAPVPLQQPKAPPPPAAARAPAAAQGSKFGITVLSGPAQGQRFRLPLAGCVVGRSKGSILFEDPTVSPQHATFVVRDDRLYVRDEGSLSGVYVTISAREQIPANAFFTAGTRLFRFTGPHFAPPLSPGRPTVYGAPVPPGQAMYMLEEILLGGRPGRAITSYGPLMTVGQAHCDFSFPQDPELAMRHVEVAPNPQGASVQDLSGGLGTFVRIPPQSERPLQPGDRIRIGQQVVRIEGLA
jgi:pSer/pThr/pTyr-binding forkhead associated (FHA) protein